MTALRKPVAGTITQKFGKATVHIDGHPIGWPEPAGWLNSDSGGPRRARTTELPDSVYHKYVHYGEDYAAPAGTPIVAQHNGVILRNGYSASRGYYILVGIGRAANGKIDTLTIDQHVQRGSRDAVGTHVLAGERIARVGSTGASTGPHDHSAVYHTDVADPDWTKWATWPAYNPKRLRAGGDMADVAWL